MGLRTVVERLSRGVVLKRRLPPEFGGGKLFVSPEAGGLRYWRRDLRRYDPSLLGLVDEFVTSGMKVWDVGANVGLFTFAAAYRAGVNGFVLGIEPDVDNLVLLFGSERARDRKVNAPVEILAAGIGAPGSSVARLMIASRSRCSNALDGFGLSQSGGAKETRPIPLFTLDGLIDVFPRPNLVKIDVEGAELLVLQGASRLLDEVRPTLLMEVSDQGDKANSILQLLKNNRYRLFDAEHPKHKRKELNFPTWSTLAIPA